MDIGALMVRIEGDAKPLEHCLDEAVKGLTGLGELAGKEFEAMAGKFSSLFTNIVKGDIRGIATSLLELLKSWPEGEGGGWLDGLLGSDSLLGGLADLLSSGRAGGGAVSGGQPVLVGERGPEIFTPYGSGQITPNHALPKGNAVTLNMTVVTPDAQSFRASQGQILAEAAQSLARAQRFY